MKNASSIVPNTTPLPHLIIREWMPRLTDVELRVLLIVVDQTLGWVEDAETGRRKGEDWISSSQFVHKTGRSRKHISKALGALVEEFRIVEAVDSRGRLLDTPEKRQGKFGKIFYRLSLRAPEITLFDKVRPISSVSSSASKGRTIEGSETKRRTQKGRTTKDTHEQKENTLPAEPAAKEIRPKKDHTKFIEFFFELVKTTRGITPKITGADGSNLKKALAFGIEESTLEQIALYFLAHPGYKQFSPSISTLLSSGIVNGLLNKTRNDPEFWKNLDRYAGIYLPKIGGPTPRAAEESIHRGEIQDAMKLLLEKMRMPKAPEEHHAYA